MKRQTFLGFCSSIALIAICLFGLILAWIWIDLPRRAENNFGTPAERLNFVERLELSARLLFQTNELKNPLNPAGASRTFIIEHGESTFSITNRLQEQGFITSAPALRDYLVYSGLDTTLQAGEFQLSPRQNAMEIAWAMQDATPNEVAFRILPGWRLEEIAAALKTSGLEFSANDFLRVAYEPPAEFPIVGQLPSGASLEGFLYPDSYRVPRKIDVYSFLETVLTNFQIKVDQELQAGFEQQGLDLFQAVTLASIIQREAVLEEEMTLIASVFHNRLAAGMNLETDPTVQYALGFQRSGGTWWKNPLSLEDLKATSAYNTYINPGLPIGPISNPGSAALRAVAFPDQTTYYYFRSACDGSGKHSFAETFEQHQANACPE